MPIDRQSLWMYLVPFASLLGAGVGVPIPEELPVVAAGALTGHQATEPQPAIVWWIMLPLLIVGVVVGDGFLYCIGRQWGQRLLKISWLRRRLPPAKQERIERNFRRYGIWILLGARLMPGIRGWIFVMAGINRLPLTKFLIADLLYAIPGVSMLFFLAYYFTDQFVAVIDQAEKWKSIIALVLLSGAILFLLRFFLKHPIAEGDPEDVPIIGRRVASHYRAPANSSEIKDEKKEPPQKINAETDSTKEPPGKINSP